MTTLPQEKARQMLKDAGLYCTEARIAILQILMQAARPLRRTRSPSS